MGKSIESVKALSEEIASIDYHQCSGKANLKKDAKYDVDAVDLLASKVDVLTQWFDRLDAPILRSFSSMVYKVGVVCDIYDTKRYMVANYQTNFQ